VECGQAAILLGMRSKTAFGKEELLQLDGLKALKIGSC
jgi:hypothetical protein